MYEMKKWSGELKKNGSTIANIDAENGGELAHRANVHDDLVQAVYAAQIVDASDPGAVMKAQEICRKALKKVYP